MGAQNFERLLSSAKEVIDSQKEPSRKFFVEDSSRFYDNISRYKIKDTKCYKSTKYINVEI